MEFPALVVDMICIVELGPKEEHEENVGIVDDCMTVREIVLFVWSLKYIG